MADVTQILTQIAQLADLDCKLEALPLNTGVVWWSDDKGAPTMVMIGKPAPFDANTEVLAWFENDEEIRVYCAVTKKPEGVKDDNAVRHKRYNLVKASPVFTFATMPMATMLTEIAGEWRAVRDETILKSDLETDDCEKCNEEVKDDWAFCAYCGAEISAEPTSPQPNGDAGAAAG